MEKDIEELKQYVTKLRTDLTATNLVLTAAIGAMPPDQHRATLRAIAQLSVMQEQTAEQAQKPEAIALLQASIGRMYSQLEGLLTMRKD